jgi:hypothetical protein
MQNDLNIAASREAVSASEMILPREEPRSEGRQEMESLLESRAPIRAICWSGQRVVRVIRDN